MLELCQLLLLFYVFGRRLTDNFGKSFIEMGITVNTHLSHRFLDTVAAIFKKISGMRDPDRIDKAGSSHSD